MRISDWCSDVCSSDLIARHRRADRRGGAEDRAAVMTSAIAKVPTAHGSKYLQQLCKHWQHNLAVEFTPGHGTVAFPKDARGATWTDDALVTFDSDADALAVRIDASGEIGRASCRDRVCQAV